MVRPSKNRGSISDRSLDDGLAPAWRMLVGLYCDRSVSPAMPGREPSDHRMRMDERAVRLELDMEPMVLIKEYEGC